MVKSSAPVVTGLIWFRGISGANWQNSPSSNCETLPITWIGGRLLIANQLDQSNYLPNQKHGTPVNSYDLTRFIWLFQVSCTAPKASCAIFPGFFTWLWLLRRIFMCLWLSAPVNSFLPIHQPFIMATPHSHTHKSLSNWNSKFTHEIVLATNFPACLPLKVLPAFIWLKWNAARLTSLPVTKYVYKPSLQVSN
jgi:hypothetical protein